MKDRITFHGSRMSTWSIHKVLATKKLVWLGAVEAMDEREAMEKAAIQFKVPDSRLVATRMTR